MFKVRDIAVGTFLVIIGVLCLSKILCGQEADVYSVENYHGGLNVATDGTNLRPDEALTLTNLTLDTVGVLVPRQGFSYYDSAAVKADSEIQAIYIYEPYIDTMRMVIAVGGFVYLNDNLIDPGNVNWDTLRLSFTGDSLDATASSATMQTTGGKNPWWYLNTWGDNVTGDHIIVDEDNSETEYDIQKINWVDHDKMTITPVYAGTTGIEMNYTIYKKIHGNPFITQFRNELYICDSDGFPIIYDDTSYSFTASLDSGVISAAVSLNDTLTAYSTGRAKVIYKQNKAYGNSDVVWQPSWGDSTWEFTIHTRKPKAQRGSRRSKNPDDLEDVSWSSKIIGVDSTERVLTLENTYPWAVIDLWNDYEIKTIYYMCVLDSGIAVIDSSKNWMDIHLGDNYLTGLRAVFGAATSYGMYYNRMIGCNSDIAFAVPKTNTNAGIVADEVYYIFAGGVPYQFTSFVTDDTRMEYPRFRQVAFYNNQLFGLGERKLVGNYSLASGIRADHDVIWYSYPSIPRYSPALDYNFSIDENEANTAFLPLRNNLYIGTENSIWGYFGVMGESFLRKVVSDNGIPDFDNCVKASEEYGYFANRTGVYRFDGVRPQKISWDIDPIIRKNYGSRIVMGYFPVEQKLFLSFPDSNVTYFYDERFGDRNVWVGPWDFGMTCFYAPADTNIFYFGHSEFKGRVYYYPNGLFQDIVAIDDTNDIAIEYESGWQAYGGYWTVKRIKDMYFPVKSSNTPTIKIYTDFSATACDTVLCDSSGRFVYRKQFDNDCLGEYFKVAFSDSIDALTIFGGYRIEYVEGIPWQK